MIERLPSRSDSKLLLALDPESKDFMLLTLLNGPGSSKYVFSGKRNRKYMFMRRQGERRHTIMIPKSVWDADDAEVAKDILSRNTGHTILVQHVRLENPNQVINQHEPDGQAPEQPPALPALPNLPEPSEKALQRAAELLVEQTLSTDDGQETDELDEDDPLPDVLMPEAAEIPSQPAKPAKRKGK